jgi:hypothetical protein
MSKQAKFISLASVVHYRTTEVLNGFSARVQFLESQFIVQTEYQ